MKKFKYDDCCGCTACFNICPRNAIKMQKDKKGFIVPVANHNCIDCGLCEKYCPLTLEHSVSLDKRTAYAAKRKDSYLRSLSQSGGAFSVFAEYVISKGGVVYGVSLDDELNAVYSRASTITQLEKLRGSKYVQAYVGNVYKQVRRDLVERKTVLFSGTPCHVHGLLEYLSVKKVITEKLITVDLICHGVVSPQVYEEYKDSFQRRYRSKITSFNFRDKQFGWHGHVINIGTKTKHYFSTDYVKIFYSHFALRDCCYSCRYTNLDRVSDISIGDCWGIEKKHMEFDDNKGCSLILINSQHGKQLFSATNNKFDFLKIDITDYMQPNLLHPTPKPEKFDCFWSDYSKFGFDYATFKYCDTHPETDRVIKVDERNHLKKLTQRIRNITRI